ncbi:MAG: hypothetical protein EBU56_06445, partial [Burkholderiaceae bacterium]|nr:hypothetical protein [Burkholderiaceae bacterium]
KIGTIFDEYVIIVYYDVSNDNTLEFLKQYREKNNKLIFYVNRDPLSKYRTHRIAKGRNKCLNMIRSSYTDKYLYTSSMELQIKPYLMLIF